MRISIVYTLVLFWILSYTIALANANDKNITLSNDICNLTPHVIQSWQGNSSLTWTSNTNNIRIEGTYQSNGHVGIWVNPHNPTVTPKRQCDGKECIENPSLYINEPPIVDLDLPSGNNIDAGWQEIELANGKYNRVSSGGSGTIKFTGDTYYIENLVIGGSSKVILSKNTKLYVNRFELSGSARLESNNNLLHIWAENYRGKSALVQVDESINALVFSRDKVIVSGGNGVINGRVTAKHVEIKPDGKIIDDGQKCESEKPELELKFIPKKEFFLLCESPLATIVVTDAQGKEVSEQVDVNISIPIGTSISAVIEGRYNGNNSYSTNSSGLLIIRLESDTIGTYRVEAHLVADPSKKDFGDFLISPYKFEASDVYAIAGLEARFDLEVLACKNDQVTRVSGYQGSKNLNVSDFSLDVPTINQGAIQGSLSVNSNTNWASSTVTFNFDHSAKASGSIVYEEVGKVSFKLSDPFFECPKGYQCTDNNGESWSNLEGIVDVYVRPWQFAICTDKNSDGNSWIGNAFVAAGEEFEVYAKPIKFTNNISQLCTNNLVTKNYRLSDAKVDVVYTLDSPNNNGAILGNLSSSGNLSQSSVDIMPQDHGYKFSKLKYSEVGSFNFIVNETGHFYGSILGGLSGEKSIGRFYPKYFLQGNPEWNVAGQNDIAYLGQPYDSTVHKLYPMASGEITIDKALNNYRYFDPTLQTGFGVLDDNSVDNLFLLDTRAGSWNEYRKYWLLVDRSSILRRVTDSNKVSRKDTPFNTSDPSSTSTNFGFVFIDSVDPVSFSDDYNVTDSVVFLIQPPARYGRMVLQDTGGNSNTVMTIPLKVEFWDGNKFVINVDDGNNISQSLSSSFNSENYCKQLIWSGDNRGDTSILLNGKGNVSDGQGKLSATQTTIVGGKALREQARFWLRMDDATPLARINENPIVCSGSHQNQPWLRYNWRQLGDEDPSALITFGISRGSDRVIYRGEQGMYGR